MTDCAVIKNKIGLDTFIISLGILYILLPISIFFFGWLRWYIALPLNLVILYFAKVLFLELTARKVSIIRKESILFWIIVICASVFWVYFSGIGGFSFQNWDHIFRNAVYRDLCNYSWPVIYDLSLEPENVQKITGGEKSSLTYYFTWWLPAALLSKFFSLSEFSSFLVLYIWACLGIFLTLFFIVRYYKKCSYIILIVLIFFSGLDAVPIYIKHHIVATTQHIEWWASFFQYSSNTTMLYWSFNQAIPIWLMLSIFINLKNSRCTLGLISLSIAYSVWSTFGLVPYGIYLLCKKFKQSVSFNNIVIPAIMLLFFGSFYLASNNENTSIHAIFENKEPNLTIIVSYIEFAFIEFLIYFILMGRKAFSYRFYWITLLELLIIPLFYIRVRDFIPRASIPALFLLMCYVINYLLDLNLSIFRKSIFIVALIIGALTPYTEINRSIQNTNFFTSNLNNTIYSFGNIQSKDESEINTVKINFMNYDLDRKLFFRCFAKKNYRDRYR